MADIQTIDLDNIDSSMIQETVEINTDANPMEAPPPADDGTYRVKLVGATDWQESETKPGKSGESRAFLKTKFSAIILDPGANENKRLFANVNTLTFDGKSQMGYIILQAMGGNTNPDAVALVKSLTNYVDLAKAFKNLMLREPEVKVRTKWVASYNESEDPEKPKYKTALSGQNQFPRTATGFRPVVNVKGHGEVTAQAVIQDYFPV